MSVHAFVIHLLHATGRRENAHAILDACGLEGELWEAVDGAAMSSPDLSATIDSGLFGPTYPMALKAEEIGCFLSHRQIWAEIVRRDLRAGLIIEDSAVIERAIFPRALALARTHIDSLGYIQFHAHPAKGVANLIDTDGPCALCVPRLTGLDCSAQMVSQRTAQHLLNLSEVFDRPVDAFLQSHWHTGLRPAAIHPSGVKAMAGAVGDTPKGGVAQETLADRIGRKWARFAYDRAMARAARASQAPAQGGFRHEAAA